MSERFAVVLLFLPLLGFDCRDVARASVTPDGKVSTMKPIARSEKKRRAVVRTDTLSEGLPPLMMKPIVRGEKKRRSMVQINIMPDGTVLRAIPEAPHASEVLGSMVLSANSSNIADPGAGLGGLSSFVERLKASSSAGSKFSGELFAALESMQALQSVTSFALTLLPMIVFFFIGHYVGKMLIPIIGMDAGSDDDSGAEPTARPRSISRRASQAPRKAQPKSTPAEKPKATSRFKAAAIVGTYSRLKRMESSEALQIEKKPSTRASVSEQVGREKSLNGGYSVKIMSDFEYTNDVDTGWDVIKPQWTPEAVKQILEDFMVYDNWNTEMVHLLSRELSKEKAELVVRRSLGGEDELVHVAKLVMVFLVDGKSERLVQELERPSSKRDIGYKVEKVPKARILINESLHDAVRRCLKEKLEIVGDAVKLSPDCLFYVTEVESMNRSLPGIVCVDRHYFFAVTVETADDAELKCMGLPDGRLTLKDYSYEWKPIKDCTNLKKHSRDWLLQIPFKVQKSKQAPFDSVVVPWTKPSVLAILEQHGIVSVEERFGKPLSQLVGLLKQGKLELAVNPSTNQLVCLEESVVCLIKTRDGSVVFRHDLEGPASSAYLPNEKKFPGESAWQAALRFAHHKLQLSQPTLQLSETAFKEGHNGQVTMAELRHMGLEWDSEDRPPQCKVVLFLVEGMMS